MADVEGTSDRAPDLDDEDAGAEKELSVLLNAYVAAGGAPQILDVFRAHLERDVSDATYETLFRSLNLLVHSDLLSELIWAIGQRPENIRRDFDEEGFSPDTQGLLTEILVRYAEPLRKAYYKSPLALYPDDWQNVSPEVLLNLTDSDTEVQTFIRKRNREGLVVRGSVTSFLRWVRIMNEALLTVGSREPFSESETERYLRVLDQVREMFAGETEAGGQPSGGGAP